MSRDDELERLARIAVDCGFRLHTDLGPGLLESVYETVLAAMLVESGLTVSRQVPVPIVYRGVVFDNAFKADLIVEGRLLMNFGQATFKSGIQRIANDYRSGWQQA